MFSLPRHPEIRIYPEATAMYPGGQIFVGVTIQAGGDVPEVDHRNAKNAWKLDSAKKAKG
jgi:hypothetical protein